MRLSSFCPLDLYSGDPPRVARGLQGLWESWYLSSGTKNNLRIFVGGKVIRVCSDTLIMIFALLMYYAKPDALGSLFDVLGHDVSLTAIPALRDSFVDAILPLLLSSPILQRLAVLQRTLDALDIEGLAKFYEEVRGVRIGYVPEGEPEPTMQEWDSFIDEFFTRQHSQLEGSDESTLRYHILAYALSATVKDCSLMLRIPTNGEPSLRTIKVIDLDIKNISRLALWQSLDMEVVSQYASVPDNDRKVCIDSCIQVTV